MSDELVSTEIVTSAGPHPLAVVAWLPCGCWAGSSVESAPDAPRAEADWRRDGCHVETMPMWQTGLVLLHCRAHDPRAAGAHAGREG